MYKINAECLTPVCIWDGSEAMPWEYAVDGDTFRRFNLSSLYAGLDEKQRAVFEEKLEKEDGTLHLRKWIWENKVSLKEKIQNASLYEADTDKLFRDAYAKNISKTRYDNDLNQLAVKSFPRMSGAPYIPGSSLKGALRTALLWKLGMVDNAYVEDVEDSKHINQDAFSHFKVSDAILGDGIRLTVGGLKRNKNLKQFFEYVPKGTRVEFTLSVDTDSAKRKCGRLDWSSAAIREACRDFSKVKTASFLSQLRFFDTLALTAQDKWKRVLIADLKKFLEGLYPERDTDDVRVDESFIVTIGFGVGFWTKTFLRERHPSPPKAPPEAVKRYTDSRLVIPRTWWHGGGSPAVGFLRCTIVEAE